jgi:hypothetical protein
MSTRKATPKQQAYLFFLRNAVRGRSYTARELAKAERDAAALGFTFEWCSDWSCDHQKKFGYEPASCQTCLCRSFHGEVLASLSCIDDADAAYRRVVQAELALEALNG